MENKITSVIIQDANIFKNFLINEMITNCYCLIGDDYYWEEITKQRSINREIYVIGRNKMERNSSILKALEFYTFPKVQKKELYELVQILKNDIDIIAAIFNPKINKCILLFLNNDNDRLLEKKIKDFLELEAMGNGE